MYTIDFRFDCEGEPPDVMICCSDGAIIAEILEEPKMLSSNFSWDEKDWEAGPIAKKILDRLNNKSAN